MTNEETVNQHYASPDCGADDYPNLNSLTSFSDECILNVEEEPTENDFDVGLLPLLACFILLSFQIFFNSWAFYESSLKQHDTEGNSKVLLTKTQDHYRLFVEDAENHLPSHFNHYKDKFYSTLQAARPQPDSNLSIASANACFKERSLFQRLLHDEPIAAYQPVGLHAFVLVNGYRTDERSFAIVGLVVRALLDSNTTMSCLWFPLKGSVIHGRVRATYASSVHGLKYETIIIHCALDSTTLENNGGQLHLTIDGENFEVYSEAEPLALQSTGASVKHGIGFCSYPIFRDVQAERISEWVHYAHNLLNVTYFVLNDGGGVNARVYERLKPFVDAGMMEVNDVRGAYQYESQHDVLFLNDCIYRMQRIAKWSLVLEFNDYLYIKPPQTLPSLLQEHESKPWLTFGSLLWSPKHCRANRERHSWPVERMVFHELKYYCEKRGREFDEHLCPGRHGRRKYIINPLKISTVEVHRPIEPYNGGVDVHASLAWINHYQGLLHSSRHCEQIFAKHNHPRWWVEDHSMARVVSMLE